MNTFKLLELNDKLEVYRHISGVTIYDVLYFMTLKVQKKTHHSIYHLWHSRANQILAIIQT